MCSLDSDIMDCVNNVTDNGITWTMLSELYNDQVLSMLPSFMYQPWFCSLIGSILIGLSGIFPLLVIPIGDGADLKHGAGARTLNVLLSFAVGCLLGDVFLHLLPEVWGHDADEGARLNKGLWVLAGMLIFIILEKMFSFHAPAEPSDEKLSTEVKREQSATDTITDTYEILNNNGNEMSEKHPKTNGHSKHGDGKQNGHCKSFDVNNYQNGIVKQNTHEETSKSVIHVSGYLNLMANSFDNFTHGLAVGGSFLISFPHGVLTTAAILLHEIPHEVGDFAILLRSGFSRWDAARAQILTATAGMFGSLTAVMLSEASGTIETRTSWILPFTAGGFLHIALVTVLPDLLKEENPFESFLQLAALLSGIGVMAGMASMT